MQYDLCYGEPGKTGAVWLTLNNKDQADKLCAAVNKADVFQGKGLEASVREVEREKPAEDPPKAPRARARKPRDAPDDGGA